MKSFDASPSIGRPSLSFTVTVCTINRVPLRKVGCRCSAPADALPAIARAQARHKRRNPISVSAKCEHAPGRSAPPTKNAPNSQVVLREAQLPGAREALHRRAPGAAAALAWGRDAAPLERIV